MSNMLGIASLKSKIAPRWGVHPTLGTNDYLLMQFLNTVIDFTKKIVNLKIKM